MQKETLELIRKDFVRAYQQPCDDIPDLEKEFLEYLSQEVILEADISKMDFFLNGLRASINAREQTMDFTELAADIMHVTVHIIIWINEQHSHWLNGADEGKGIDAIVSSRRKALDSELVKRLEKADNLMPTNIDDLFGIRYVICNPNGGIHICCVLAQKIFNILCNYSRKDREDFIEFVKSTFNKSTQSRIFRVLEIPFQLKEIKRSDSPEEFSLSKLSELPRFSRYMFDLPTQKDRDLLKNFLDYMKFYFDPKKNGYQSLHFVLEIPASSEDMPGAKIEIQFRTENMDHFANNIIAKSHKGKVSSYKKYFRLSRIDMLHNNLRAFFDYSVENDLDGIHNSKKFYNRRINQQSFKKATYNLKKK